MNAMRALRERGNSTPEHAVGLPAEDVVFHSPVLTRGLLGWDTLGRPDPGIFDTLGGADPGAFDTLGGADPGAFDTLGGADPGIFDTLGGADPASSTRWAALTRAGREGPWITTSQTV